MEDRGDLITVMAAEGGKTVAEADPGQRAIDFARYYADRAEDLERSRCEFTPDRVVLVTPPWNFPVAIPMGSVLSALAAGAVIIKPAHPTPGASRWRRKLCTRRASARGAAGGAQRQPGQPGRWSPTATSNRDPDRIDRNRRHVRRLAARPPAWPAGLRRDLRQERPDRHPAADLDLAVADLVKSAFGHAGQKCSAASWASWSARSPPRNGSSGNWWTRSAPSRWATRTTCR